MRKLLVIVLFWAARRLGATAAPGRLGRVDGLPVPALAPDDLRPFAKVAGDCIILARHLGNRQNSDSTLTAGECTKLVCALLSAGNLMSAALVSAEGVSCNLPPSTTAKSSTGPAT